MTAKTNDEMTVISDMVVDLFAAADLSVDEGAKILSTILLMTVKEKGIQQVILKNHKTSVTDVITFKLGEFNKEDPECLIH